MIGAWTAAARWCGVRAQDRVRSCVLVMRQGMRASLEGARDEDRERCAREREGASMLMPTMPRSDVHAMRAGLVGTCTSLPRVGVRCDPDRHPCGWNAYRDGAERDRVALSTRCARARVECGRVRLVEPLREVRSFARESVW